MSEIKTVGFVGDGQLGRMSAEAALPMGFKVTTLGMAGPNSPAAQVGARQMEGSLMDGDAIRRLAHQTDVLTWEIEHINSEVLIALLEEGYNIQPSPLSLALIQDKYKQKMHLLEHHLPVADCMVLDSAADLQQARDQYGDTVMVKTRTGGFDGRGNLVADSQVSWDGLTQHFMKGDSRPNLYAEKMVPFQRELAVIGARDMSGKIALYPVVETMHSNNICDMVLAPAYIDSRVYSDAEELGRATIESFAGAGVYAVEMFLDEHDRVLVNEVAPRVHNSGHFSIEGSETSQFEQHIRAVTGMPLGPTGMKVPAATMINILGTRTGEIDVAAAKAIGSRDIYVHLYGKSLRKDRKVGHITVLEATHEAAKAAAIAARAQIDA